MSQFRVLLMIIAASFVSGCVQMPRMSPELSRNLNEELYCDGEIQCKEMWERAIYFVSTNAGYKISVQNDLLIETFGPNEPSPELHFKVVKEPKGEGRYRIWTYASCANIFGCRPSWQVGVARAKLYIRTGDR